MRILNLNEEYATLWHNWGTTKEVERFQGVKSGSLFLGHGVMQGIPNVVTIKELYEGGAKKADKITASYLYDDVWQLRRVNNELQLGHTGNASPLYWKCKADALYTDNNLVFSKQLNLSHEVKALMKVFDTPMKMPLRDRSCYFYLTDDEIMRTRVLAAGSLVNTPFGFDCTAFVSVPKTGYFIDPEENIVRSCTTGKEVRLTGIDLERKGKKRVTMDTLLRNAFSRQ